MLGYGIEYPRRDPEKDRRFSTQTATIEEKLRQRFGPAEMAEPEEIFSGNRPLAAVVGAGPAGLATAAYLAEHEVEVVLLDERPIPSGNLLLYGYPFWKLEKRRVEFDYMVRTLSGNPLIHLVPGVGVDMNAGDGVAGKTSQGLTIGELNNIADLVVNATGTPSDRKHPILESAAVYSRFYGRGFESQRDFLARLNAYHNQEGDVAGFRIGDEDITGASRVIIGGGAGSRDVAIALQSLELARQLNRYSGYRSVPSFLEIANRGLVKSLVSYGFIDKNQVEALLRKYGYGYDEESLEKIPVITAGKIAGELKELIVPLAGSLKPAVLVYRRPVEKMPSWTEIPPSTAQIEYLLEIRAEADITGVAVDVERVTGLTLRTGGREMNMETGLVVCAIGQDAYPIRSETIFQREGQGEDRQIFTVGKAFDEKVGGASQSRANALQRAPEILAAITGISIKDADKKRRSKLAGELVRKLRDQSGFKGDIVGWLAGNVSVQTWKDLGIV